MSRRIVIFRMALGATILVFVLAPAYAATRSFDLRHEPTLKIRGSGTVSYAGDVNGDGVPDVALSGSGDRARRLIYVIFGPLDKSMRLQDVTEGFRIEEADPDDALGRAVAAGDVNGDGFGDMVIDASRANQNGREVSGAAYVVFGKPSTDTVRLAEFEEGTQEGAGFRIDGPSTLALAGEATDGLGDVNQDGLADVVVGSPFASTYVVFGKKSTEPVDLAAFDLNLQGTAGYRIDHPSAYSSDRHYWAAGAGDVNGDGKGDVILSVVRKSQGAGNSWVVFGKSDPLPLDVGMLGPDGFRLNNVSGWLSRMGDVNDDGFDDVVIADHLSYVIFGKDSSETVTLNNYRGYRIDSALSKWGCPTPSGDCFPNLTAVVGGMDVNDDGTPDVALGFDRYNFNHRHYSGSVYVVFGQTRRRVIRLANLRRKGFRIDGAYRDDHLGISVAMLPDANSDGRAEILMGTFPRARTPRSYLFWGRR